MNHQRHHYRTAHHGHKAGGGRMKLRLVNLLREFLGAVLLVSLLDDRYPDRKETETNGMED